MKNVADKSERCMAKTAVTYRREKNPRCPNQEHFLINGKKLCGRHAALEALALALKAGQCVHVQQKPLPFQGVVVHEDARS